DLDEEKLHDRTAPSWLAPGTRANRALRLPSSRALLAVAVDDTFEHAVQPSCPRLPAVLPANHLPRGFAETLAQCRILEESDEALRERYDVAVPYQDARFLRPDYFARPAVRERDHRPPRPHGFDDTVAEPVVVRCQHTYVRYGVVIADVLDVPRGHDTPLETTRPYLAQKARTRDAVADEHEYGRRQSDPHSLADIERQPMALFGPEPRNHQHDLRPIVDAELPAERPPFLGRRAARILGNGIRNRVCRFAS